MTKPEPMLSMACIGVAVLTLGTGGWILAQSAGAIDQRPLDLPSGGGGDRDDEKDIPETITFFGQGYEGDGFFWCLDRSGSMGEGGLIERLKSEMSEAISQLSEESEFGIVAFSSGYTIWSPHPQVADRANRASALAFVGALSPAGMTCMAPAGVQTIAISDQCDKDQKHIIVLSDGVPNCPGPEETLAAMTAANWQRTPIDTIYIASDPEGIAFMQQLAALNGGTFSTPLD